MKRSMKNNKIIKKSIEKRKRNVRITTVGVFATIMFCLLAVRLGYVQLYKGEYYKYKASNQQKKEENINPSRGTIYDAKGEVLAQSVSVDSVFLNPGKVTYSTSAKVENEKIADGLSRIFSLDYEETLQKVSSNKSVVTIAKKVENDKIDELRKWMSENNITAGININADTKRYYPFNDLASNLIGFCGDDNTGLYGLEERMNDTLTGTTGKIVTFKSLNGQAISDDNEQYVPAENGNNIYLTIDTNIQSIAEKYLEQAVKGCGAEDGGNVVIMNPQNGDILAMATYPDYNLNEPFKIEPTGYSQEEWATLDAATKQNVYSNLFKNEAVSGVYEPGSTFKLIMTSIALEENVVQTDTENDFYCNGIYHVADRDIKCWRPTSNPHGYQSLRDAVKNSCNPAFMQLGQRVNAAIGVDKIYEYFDDFGLMDKVGSQIARAYPGQFYDQKRMGPVELATTSFGENFTISPLQLTAAVCAIANDGLYVEPRIVKQIENPDTKSIEQAEIVEKKQVISKETADKVKDMMLSVVQEGTGKHAKVEGYSIGGKSGTSEPSENNPDEGYVASFIGISPIENTQVVCLVVLYNVKGEDHQGGQLAGPVVAQIMSEILPILGVTSNSQELAQSEISTLIAVPNVKDKTVAAARTALEQMGFSVEIDNPVDENSALVIEQTPKPGIALEGGSKVYLNTSQQVEKVIVPNLKGMSIDEATRTLSASKLNIKVDGTSGIVITQEPAFETEVNSGSVVTVTVKEKLKESQ